MNSPLAIDLFCGLGGWTDGLLAEGYDVVGFDIQRHVYGGARYPAQLVIQDVLTIHGCQFHGCQFHNAALIVASPPCQKYSYLAMPWSRSTSEHSQAAKALRRKWETEGPDNRLFDACFRIQREACEAAGRHIPMVVENVRGAQPWVGRAAWSFGSFYLWGDVPALMPITLKRAMKTSPDGTGHPPGSWFAIADSAQGDRRETKNTGGSWFDVAHNNTASGHGRNPVNGLTPAAREKMGVKVESLDGGRRTDIGKGARFTSRDCGVEAAVKQPAGNGDWFNREARDGGSSARYGSKSNARKTASAQIAKIPIELARHIAATYRRALERPA